MSDDVLKIFEGLTENQVKELRRRIIEILPELRREVTKTEKSEITQIEKPRNTKIIMFQNTACSDIEKAGEVVNSA